MPGIRHSVAAGDAGGEQLVHDDLHAQLGASGRDHVGEDGGFLQRLVHGHRWCSGESAVGVDLWEPVAEGGGGAEPQHRPPELTGPTSPPTSGGIRLREEDHSSRSPLLFLASCLLLLDGVRHPGSKKGLFAFEGVVGEAS